MIFASLIINVLLIIAIIMVSSYSKKKRKITKEAMNEAIKAIKEMNETKEAMNEAVASKELIWLASGEVMNELLHSRRIDVAINANLKNVQNKNDLISIFQNNIAEFKIKMKALEQISIKKRNTQLSDLEWKLVFFSVLLNQNYEYGATSSYLHLSKEKILQSLPHIKSLHCSNLGTALYAIVANIVEDFNLQSIIYSEHNIYFYANEEIGLLLDPTFNIYGFVSKSGMKAGPLETANKITDFVFLENKNNANTGLTWHNNMNKFQASVLYYLGGATIVSESERVHEVEGLSSNEEAQPSYPQSFEVYNAEVVRKINY